MCCQFKHISSSWEEIQVRIKKIYFNQQVNKQHFPALVKLLLRKYFIKAMEDVFLCLHSLNTLGAPEFSTVMQTIHCISGLHTCHEFFQLPLRLDQAV